MPDIVLTTLNAKYSHAAFGLRYLFANLGELQPRDVQRTLIDVELRDDGARLQLSEIGEEIAQPERGVAELGVERGEDDVRHRREGSN